MLDGSKSPKSAYRLKGSTKYRREADVTLGVSLTFLFLYMLLKDQPLILESAF